MRFVGIGGSFRLVGLWCMGAYITVGLFLLGIFDPEDKSDGWNILLGGRFDTSIIHTLLLLCFS